MNQISSKIILFRWIIAAGFFHASVCDNQAASYTVQGKIIYETAVRATNLISFFSVEVSNCVWGITVIQQEKPDEIYKQTFDGQTLSVVAKFKPLKTKAANDIGNDSILILEETGVPNSVFGGTGMPQLWLAFASPCHLAGATNNLLELVWFTNRGLREKHYKTPATWSQSVAAPFLPETVSFFLDAKSFAEANGNVVPGTGPLARWALFDASQFRDFPSGRFPMRFEYTQYHLQQTPPKIAYQFFAEVTNVVEGITSDAFVPGVGQVARVEDKRFASKTNGAASVPYVITDGQIPDKTDTNLLRKVAVRNKLGVALAKEAKGRMISIIGLAVFIVVAVGLPFLYLLKGKESSKS